MNMTPGILASLSTAHRLLGEFLADESQLAAATAIAEDVVACLQSGGKIMSCGNGGSMADAMHFAEEWSGRFRGDRKPYPVFAFSDPTHMSCVANDYGFEHVFSRMVEAFGKPGDMVFILSTSGNSQNLVLAAEAARSNGVKVVGFLGRGGGKVGPLCDHILMAPGETSDRIQEIHMLVLHIIIEVAERALGH